MPISRFDGQGEWIEMPQWLMVSNIDRPLKTSVQINKQNKHTLAFSTAHLVALLFTSLTLHLIIYLTSCTSSTPLLSFKWIELNCHLSNYYLTFFLTLLIYAPGNSVTVNCCNSFSTLTLSQWKVSHPTINWARWSSYMIEFSLQLTRQLNMLVH